MQPIGAGYEVISRPTGGHPHLLSAGFCLAWPIDNGLDTGSMCCMQSVYEAAGGAEGLLRLAAAWHERVMADEIVSHAFSHGFHPQHTERLAAYWAEALGGAATYSEEYGDETSVVRMHSGNGPHPEMDRRAIVCFDQAMTDVGLTTEPLRQVLHDYFASTTTTTMARYHESADDVPEGLTIPRWSWHGLR
jgi:hemoglobin